MAASQIPCKAILITMVFASVAVLVALPFTWPLRSHPFVFTLVTLVPGWLVFIWRWHRWTRHQRTDAAVQEAALIEIAREYERIKDEESRFAGLDKRIYGHWKQARPKYVKMLRRNGTLEQSVSDAAEWHAQTFSQLRQNGVDAQAADELARESWFTPESES